MPMPPLRLISLASLSAFLGAVPAQAATICTAMSDARSGTVLLQVLVDTDGRPLDVRIARSSGHRELDEAARQQVLRRWHFQPAIRGGAPVQAIGLVPVAFSLSR